MGVIASKMPKGNTSRFTVDLTPTQRAQLQELVGDQDISQAEMMRNAIKLLLFLTKEVKSGGKLYMEKDGEKVWIALPLLLPS